MNTEMKDRYLATVIKEERKRRNLTQEHLAQLAEIDVRTIQRAESTGACGPETLRAIGDAFEIDCKKLIAEAEIRKIADEQGKKKENKDRDHVVRLEEVKNANAIIGCLSNAHAHIEDLPPEMTSPQGDVVGFILDYLRDCADIWSDVYPSERIKYMSEVTGKLDELRALGLACFVGSFTRRVIFKNKPEDPFSWTTFMIAFRDAKDHRILRDREGRNFIIGIIPAHTPAF